MGYRTEPHAKDEAVIRWGLLGRSKFKCTDVNEHLIQRDCVPILFRTRREAREYVQKYYGYIKHRKDSHNELHGWRLPKPVRVEIRVRQE